MLEGGHCPQEEVAGDTRLGVNKGGVVELQGQTEEKMQDI